MRNAEIADALAELATLYELDGAIRYRVLAYREAARVIRQSPVSVEELARAGRATELPGVGKTLEQKILALLEDGEIPSAAKLKQKFPPSLIEVTMVPGVGAKTARRLYDELGVSSLEDLRVHPLASTRVSAGEGCARITTHNGIAVDLRIVAPDAYGNLLQHFTGSAEHNVELRERAVGMELSVSEHGITDTATGEVARYAIEAQVYERLGLAYIEPELREADGEIAAAAAGTLPKLVVKEDLRGDLHCHTTLSDGHDTLEAMAEAARARGYAYLAVTDHSASHGFGNHVAPKRLEERIEEVRAFNSGRRDFRLLAGSEINILPDGSLDYADDLLAELDWSIASVRTSFKISNRAMTERVIAAVEHPVVDCIGHLSGRLINKREPYEIDVER